MDEWKTEIRTDGGAVQEYTVSYQNLNHQTVYYFRVIAYNQFGISPPCTAEETVRQRFGSHETPPQISFSRLVSCTAKTRVHNISPLLTTFCILHHLNLS